MGVGGGEGFGGPVETAATKEGVADEEGGGVRAPPRGLKEVLLRGSSLSLSDPSQRFSACFARRDEACLRVIFALAISESLLDTASLLS